MRLVSARSLVPLELPTVLMVVTSSKSKSTDLFSRFRWSCLMYGHGHYGTSHGDGGNTFFSPQNESHALAFARLQVKA